MRICLINSPTVAEFQDAALVDSEAVRLLAEHAPIGILSLAAVLEIHGIVPEIIDLNQFYYDYLLGPDHRRPDAGFCSYVARRLEPIGADLFGFSTLCSSFPLTIRLASALKRAHPRSAVVFGGPQASVVDVATLAAFPFIDAVVRGEAEEIFPAFLDALGGGGGAIERIPGLTFRQGARVIRNPNAPVILDLDALPLPAFHLYPELARSSFVSLELGRGCPFACQFCSTNDFFRRRFRLKSPERMIQQMSFLQCTYGFQEFDLIHDMYTVDRHRVTAFCHALLACGRQFRWRCSARTDCIDDELIALMAEAGCRGIFFGIETGSSRLQKVIEKNLDLVDAARRIECSSAHGVRTTVSLITGFPEETGEDLRATVDFLLDAVRLEHTRPQLHLLAPLAGTPLHSLFRERLILDEVFSDLSHQGWPQDLEDLALIAAHPEIFPNFYAVPSQLDRSFLFELREFLLSGVARLRWLMVALHQDADLISVFLDWRDWCDSHTDLKQYYASRQFPDDFLRYVEQRYLVDLHPRSIRVTALLAYAKALGSVREQEWPGGERWNGAISPDAIPWPAPGVHRLTLNVDLKSVMACLRRKDKPQEVGTGPKVFAICPGEAEDRELVELSPESVRLMDLCDGASSVRKISRRFSPKVRFGISSRQACVFGLEVLREEGLITFAAPIKERKRGGPHDNSESVREKTVWPYQEA